MIKGYFRDKDGNVFKYESAKREFSKVTPLQTQKEDVTKEDIEIEERT
jgi:hypothetical protein